MGRLVAGSWTLDLFIGKGGRNGEWEAGRGNGVW